MVISHACWSCFLSLNHVVNKASYANVVKLSNTPFVGKDMEVKVLTLHDRNPAEEALYQKKKCLIRQWHDKSWTRVVAIVNSPAIWANKKKDCLCLTTLKQSERSQRLKTWRVDVLMTTSCDTNLIINFKTKEKWRRKAINAQTHVPWKNDQNKKMWTIAKIIINKNIIQQMLTPGKVMSINTNY